MMAKLQRKSAKLFAENANAGIGGVAQFGSLAAGTPNYSKDVDVIQALDAYKNGWSDAVVGNKSPAIEDRNALDYLLSYQQAYIMQHGVPEWIGTETYYEHSYVVDSNGELRVSTIDNNIGHDPAQDNGGAYWGYAGARGSGKQVGEVYFSQSSSAVDNKGALPLFTGEVISNADQVYPQFYAWVLAHTGLCVTEEQYQSAISTYGECPKYVINDTNKTIRLPKLVSYIKMANMNYGVKQESGSDLNNHYHIFGWNNQNNGGYFVATSVNVTGEIPTVDNKTGTRKWNGSGSGGSFEENIASFDGNMVTTKGVSDFANCEVQHTTVFPWVFAFNAAIPASTAQAAEFQDALSNKADADLSNCTKPYIMETWHSGTEWGRIWSDGWCEQGGFVQPATAVTLREPYPDANYSVIASVDSGTSSSGASYLSVYNKTATGFYITTSENRYPACWEAKGYIS
jgi:hypothetical protein